MDGETLGPTTRRYSGAAVLGVLAVCLGVLLLSVPAASGLLGAFAVAAGLHSRAQLRADPSLRGARPSVLAFVGGVILVVIAALPLVLPLVLVALP
jgi:uncharacterized membrane protein HdeD (DUF308 family)